MLELKNVSKSFKEQKVLDNISLKLPDCGLFLIRGKSGIGKTTLFNILSNLDKPTKGEIYYNQKAYSKMKDKDIALLRSRIGFIFQDSKLISNLKIKDNLELVKLMAKTNVSIPDVLNELGIANLLDKYPSVLSGGERQRVAIAIALIKDSSIILADEPTSNLDEETKSEVFAILKKISESRLVLIVSHDSYLINKAENNILLSDLFNNYQEFSNDYKLLEPKHTKKSSFLKMTKYAFKSTKKSMILYLFSFLIFTLISLFSLLVFTINLTNGSKIALEIFDTYNFEKVTFYDKFYGPGSDDRDNETIDLDVEEFRGKYPNVKMNKVYYTYVFIEGVERYVGIVLDDSLADNELRCDEYLANILNFKIGRIVRISGCDFEITRLVTNARDSVGEFTYNKSIYINSKAFAKMNSLENLTTVYGEDMIKVNGCESNLFKLRVGIVPDIGLSDNEVIMGFDLYDSIDKEENEVVTELIINGVTYKIKNIIAGDKLYFSPSVYEKLLSINRYSLITIAKFVGIEFGLDKNVAPLIQDIYESNYHYDASNSGEIVDSIMAFYNEIALNYLSILYPISLGILFVLLMFIFYNFYYHFKNEMGFILSLGTSKIKMILFYSLPLLVLLGISLLVGTFIYYFNIPLLDGILREFFNIIDLDIRVVKFNIGAVLLSLLLLLLCYMIYIFVEIIIFSKKQLINIIYNR